MAGSNSKERTDDLVVTEQSQNPENDYMDDLNKKLETFWTMWEVWKELAKNLLAREQTSYQYIIATYWKTKK